VYDKAYYCIINLINADDANTTAKAKASSEQHCHGQVLSLR